MGFSMPFDVNLPPATQCPSWCARRCCFWQPTDDGGFVANHESANLAPPEAGIEVTIFQPDEWADGILTRVPPVLMVDQQPLPIELLKTILTLVEVNANWVLGQFA